MISLLVWAFWNTLFRVAGFWDNPKYSHGYLVPLFSAVLLWMRREKLNVPPARRGYFGGGLLAGGLVLCFLPLAIQLPEAVMSMTGLTGTVAAVFGLLLFIGDGIHFGPVSVGERIQATPDLLLPTEQEVQEYSEADRTSQAIASKIAAADELQLDYQKSLRNPRHPRILALQRERSRLQNALDARRQSLLIQTAKDRRDSPIGDTANLSLLKMERELVQATLDTAADAVQQQQNVISELETFSAALVTQKSELDAVTSVTRNMRTELQLRKAELGARSRITVLQLAEEPISSNARQRKATTVLAGLSGLAAGLIGVAFVEFRRRRLSISADISQGLGLPVLGAIPSASKRHRLSDTGTGQRAIGQSADGICSSLLHLTKDRPASVLMVTSTQGAEGTTTVASQMAASLARLGRRVLFIDCDLRRPTGHAVFGVPSGPGITDLLRGEVDLIGVVCATSVEGLQIIPAGHCDASSLRNLGRSRLRHVFEWLRDDYDFVVVDAGPVLGSADAILIGRHVDGAVLSTFCEATELPKVCDACERLWGAGIGLMGVVVNGARHFANNRR